MIYNFMIGRLPLAVFSLGTFTSAAPSRTTSSSTTQMQDSRARDFSGMGLRSPVSWAKPTTSEDDTVFSNVSVMPTERSSKNSVRSGGRFIRALTIDALLLGRHRAPGPRSTRIVPVFHALFQKRVARRALELLIVRAEFAGGHFLFGIDGK